MNPKDAAPSDKRTPRMPGSSRQARERRQACDSRYRSIIGHLDAMIELLRRKPGLDLSHELDRLLDVMLEHIGSENEYMELVGFPQTTRHRLHHQFLWVNAAELSCRFGKGLEVLPEEVAALRLSWLEHIHCHDRAFEEFLAS
ncbi:hypothetical protein FO488_17485 [Geobacter sp. FeAm09]|uniref:hypothetical protein n=1 Tax=Geobacter sp. FeAm09 TaxID=2597769 RepID=UPI0011EF0B73|nr:hypothetical protein [Geobacter sp. FeAm09]QEM69772.1 hypothetical protein FO488_17485 [Geobacter sp. FeAm09]